MSHCWCFIVYFLMMMTLILTDPHVNTYCADHWHWPHWGQVRDFWHSIVLMFYFFAYLWYWQLTGITWSSCKHILWPVTVTTLGAAPVHWPAQGSAHSHHSCWLQTISTFLCFDSDCVYFSHDLLSFWLKCTLSAKLFDLKLQCFQSFLFKPSQVLKAFFKSLLV